MADDKISVPLALQTDDNLRKVADFLRGRKGMPVRHGVEMGKRVEYFKGDKLLSFLVKSSEKVSVCAGLTDKNISMNVGRRLLQEQYIHRVERDSKNKKMLQPVPEQKFLQDGYYVWMHDGPTTMRNIMTFLLIIGFLAMTCFSIWPMWAKVGVWYMSVTFLIFMFVFTVVRLFAFFVCWMMGMEFWILPNIFDDNLSVADSFKPWYSFAHTEPQERYYRAAAIVCFVFFCVWVYNQPTEFDEYVSLTKQFTDDIYSGKLLDEMSQQKRDEIDKVKVPDLEEFMREDDHDTASDEEKKFDQFMDDKYFDENGEEKEEDETNENENEETKDEL